MEAPIKLDLADWITAILAIIAIVISLRALWLGNKQSKRQIVNDKYEEISELVNRLHYYYSGLKELFKYAERVNGKGRQEGDEKTYSDYLERLSSQDDLYKMTSRLKVLANSYLTDDLKKDVLAYNDMMEKLLMASMQRQIIMQEIFYDKGFPQIMALHNFVESIEERLQQKIGLGGKSMPLREISEYRDKVFKSKLGV